MFQLLHIKKACTLLDMEVLNTPIRFLFFLLLVGTILYFGQSVLIPFCLAGLLAMLFLPMARFLEKHKWNRALSSLMPVLALVVVSAGILALLAWQMQDFAKDISRIEERILSFVTKFQEGIEQKLGIPMAQQEKIIKESGSSGGGKVAAAVAGLAGSLLGVVVNAVVVLVYIFLFLYLRDHLKNFFLKLVRSQNQTETRQVMQESTKVSVQYISGMAMMIGMLWVMYGIGFSIVGVKYAVFFAILCGLLEIVPFVGNITGTSLTVIVTLAQGGDGNAALGVIIVYFVVQFIQTYIIEPLVVGAEVNINPLMTIFGLIVGESIWGIGGMILAIPLLGITKIICDHVPALQPYGFLIGNTKKKNKKKSFFK